MCGKVFGYLFVVAEPDLDSSSDGLDREHRGERGCSDSTVIAKVDDWRSHIWPSWDVPPSSALFLDCVY